MGPLWTQSLFGFGNMNGHVQQLFHGTRQVLDQLIFYVTAHRLLCFQSKLLTSEHEKTYFIQVHGMSTTTANFERKCQIGSLLQELHSIIEVSLNQKLMNRHTLSSKYRKGCTPYSSVFLQGKIS